MPVRKIPKSYRNVTGISASPKSIGQAMFESPLERDMLALLELDSSVERFEVQPITITWVDESDKQRKYTPDVLVHYYSPDRKPLLYEIKPRDAIRKHWGDLKPKFKAAIAFAKQNGWKFKIITDTEIRTPRLENTKFLLPYARRGPQSGTDMDILDAQLSDIRLSTPSNLLKSIYQDEYNQAKLIPTLWYLIATHQVGVDLDQKLTMSSKIWSLRS